MGSYSARQYRGDRLLAAGPAPPPPPFWTWEGGTPITLRSGETLETLSRRYGVPVAAIMQANNINNPALVHPGNIWSFRI